jgi:hypothetical protein
MGQEIQFQMNLKDADTAQPKSRSSPFADWITPTNFVRSAPIGLLC